PPVETAPDGAPGRQFAGQIPPLTAGAQHVEDGAEDVSHFGLAGPPAAGFGREVRVDQPPPGIGDVAGVVVRFLRCSAPLTFPLGNRRAAALDCHRIRLPPNFASTNRAATRHTACAAATSSPGPASAWTRLSAS